MDNYTLLNIFCRAAVLLLLLPVHEYAHARMSYALGDPTAASEGRMDLNPLVHLDPIGSLLLLVAGVGWAKPVPVDPRYYKHPRRDMALTALAGPGSNLVMGLLFYAGAQVSYGFYLRGYYAGVAGDQLYYLTLILETIASISVSLAVFNLLPIPPLDGSQLLQSLVPGRYLRWYYDHAQAINAVFLVVLLFTDVFDSLIGRLSGWILEGMYAVTGFIVPAILML